MEPARGGGDPRHGPCTPSWLHPHFPQPLPSSFPAQQHPRSRREGSMPPPRTSHWAQLGGARYLMGAGKGVLGAPRWPDWGVPPLRAAPRIQPSAWGGGAEGGASHITRSRSCDIQSGRETDGAHLDWAGTAKWGAQPEPGGGQGPQSGTEHPLWERNPEGSRSRGRKEQRSGVRARRALGHPLELGS